MNTDNNSIQITLTNEQDTQELAKKLAQLQLCGSVWLSGDLGAGKTTLTRYWLQALGHKGSVKSPTYTLVEPYHIDNKSVYHADLYRLQDPEELEFIGFEDYLADENALIIIEWATQGGDYLPQPIITIDIVKNDNDTRKVIIEWQKDEKFDERFVKVLLQKY